MDTIQPHHRERERERESKHQINWNAEPCNIEPEMVPTDKNNCGSTRYAIVFLLHGISLMRSTFPLYFLYLFVWLCSKLAKEQCFNLMNSWNADVMIKNWKLFTDINAFNVILKWTQLKVEMHSPKVKIKFYDLVFGSSSVTVDANNLFWVKKHFFLPTKISKTYTRKWKRRKRLLTTSKLTYRSGVSVEAL